MLASLPIYKRLPVPRYLRSSRTAPVRMADLLPPSLWKRSRAALRRLVICFVKVVCVFAFIGLVIVLVGNLHYSSRAAGEDYASIGDLPERIELVDSAGHFVAAIPWGTTRHCIVSVDELPQHFIETLLKIEDRQFYENGGVNWRGVARAVMHDAKSISLQHGGSGITQQLAKMWKFGIPKDATVWAKFDRKFYEWHLADRISHQFTKNEILCLYLNRIDFGVGFHGIFAAAEGLFNKLPKDLSVAESATLVAILRGPNIYSPITHPDACKKRRDLILRELAKAGEISAAESLRLMALPLVTMEKEWSARQHSNEECRIVSRELRAAGIPAEVLAKGGIKVTVTLDCEWDQRCASLVKRHVAAIDPHINKRPLQAAILVIETRTGAIKAVQCGRGDADDQWDRVFQSKRQAGSTAKPFVYQLGFAAGMNPQRMMRNDEIAPGELWLGVNWSPKNAGDQGPLLPCRDGLIFSQNRLTARVGAQVGLPEVGDFLQRLGVCKSQRVVANPSSLIGSFETRLADMTRAFTIFPMGGHESPKPHLIESVQSKAGDVIFCPKTTPTLMADQAGCRTTAECLREVFTRGTAKSALAEVSARAIGKTGSTNKAKDCWFIGADDQFTCGVWIGCDKPTPLPGGSGARSALPLWVKIMNSSNTATATSIFTSHHSR